MAIDEKFKDRLVAAKATMIFPRTDMFRPEAVEKILNDLNDKI